MKIVTFEVEPYDHIPGWWICKGPAGDLIGTWEDFEELSAWVTVLREQRSKELEAAE